MGSNIGKVQPIPVKEDREIQSGIAPVSKDGPQFGISPKQQMASACTGTVITALFVTPFDVVKTRLQAQQAKSHTNMKRGQLLNGTINAFLKIHQTEGMRSLWSALGPTLVAAVPTNLIYFVAYEQLKSKYLDLYRTYVVKGKCSPFGHGEVPFLVALLSGVTARICAVTAVSPVELMRTKMQAEKMTYAQMSSDIRNVVQSQGICGLWRGLRPTLLRDVPFSGIYWSSYETIKSHYGVTEPTFGFSFMAGAVSGWMAATITTPFDVIKTHEQVEFGEKGKTANQKTANGLGKRLAAIYGIHGLHGLFAGLGPRLCKVAPSCAIMISTFEYSRAMFYQINKECEVAKSWQKSRSLYLS